MKMRARRGAFGMVVCELAPIAQPHVLLPQPKPARSMWGISTAEVVLWGEDDLVPRGGLQEFIRTNVGATPRQPRPESELTPDELRKMKEYEAQRETQPWGWTSAMSLFGGNADRVYMSVTGPRWRCCGNHFEDEHSPWCSVEGFTDPFPESV